MLTYILSPSLHLYLHFMFQNKFINLLEREKFDEFEEELKKLDLESIKDDTEYINQPIDGEFNILQLAVKRDLENHVAKLLKGM